MMMIPTFHLTSLIFISFCPSLLPAIDVNEAPHTVGKAHPDDDLAVGADHFDEKAFLGSEAEVKEFHDLPPEESITRLRALSKKIDADGNGLVSKVELEKSILSSIKFLKEEEAAKRYPDHDYDEDGKFSWEDHLHSVYGWVPTEEQIKNGVPGIEGEHTDYLFQLKLFKAADVDKDNFLTKEEFKAFYRPEDFAHSKSLEVERLLEQHDKNKDGHLDVKEYLSAELSKDDPAEWTKIETDRFHRALDKDKNGFLNGDELISWAMPSNEDVAREETEHLIGVADSDSDGLLSADEIAEHHDTFAGSQATNYGQHLNDEL